MQVHLMLHLYLFCLGYLSLLTDAKNPCNPNPCDNYGECRPMESSFKCECLQGYGGITCKKILCDPNPCQNDGLCNLNETEEFSCNCRLGYTGKECERKIPIDPYATSTAKSSVLTTTTLGTSLPKTTRPGNTGNSTVPYTSVADTSYRSNPESTFKSTPNIKPNTKSQNILDTTSEIFEITTVVSTEIDRSTKTPVKSTTTIATTMVDDNEITMEPSTTSTAEAATTRGTTFPKTSSPRNFGNATVAYTSDADTFYKSSRGSTFKSTSNINPNTRSQNILDTTSEIFEITTVRSTEIDRKTKTLVESTVTIATTVEGDNEIPIDPYAASTASSVLTTTTLGTSFPKTMPPGNTGNATVAYTSVADTSYRSNPESTFKSTPSIKPNTKSQNILDTTSEIFEITTVGSTEIDRKTKTPVKSTTTIATTMVDDNGSCNPNPCDNWGECLITGSSFECKCLQGYAGTTCEKRLCDPNPCQNHGSCIMNERMEFSCLCRPEYTGKECETDLQNEQSTASTAKTSTPPTTTFKTEITKTAFSENVVNTMPVSDSSSWNESLSTGTIKNNFTVTPLNVRSTKSTEALSYTDDPQISITTHSSFDEETTTVDRSSNKRTPITSVITVISTSTTEAVTNSSSEINNVTDTKEENSPPKNVANYIVYAAAFFAAVVAIAVSGWFIKRQFQRRSHRQYFRGDSISETSGNESLA